MAKMTNIAKNEPTNLLKVLKDGTMRGSCGGESQSRTFQSNVGIGLKLRPLLKLVTALRFLLLGAI